MPPIPKIKGLTFIELLITLAIVTLVLGFVVPSGQALLVRSRITGHINELSAALHYAKLLSIEMRSKVIVCPTENTHTCSEDWSYATMLFEDKNADNERNDNEPIKRILTSRRHVHMINGPQNPIRFYESGITSSPASLIVCPKQSQYALYNRALTISLQGRIRLSKDANGDGYHQKSNGERLLCDG